MQNYNSRYLISWDVFNEAIEIAKKKQIKFERLKNLEESEFKKKYVRLTIDDGGGSSLEIAKLLKQKNIKAFFFIATNYIGKKGYLNKKEIVEIYKMGHVIGSHSHTHPNPFCELQNETINQEVLLSKNILENIIDNKVDTFSVPGGEIRRNTLNLLCNKNLGLKEIYISTPYQGECNFDFNIETKIYGRLCIERNMNCKKISNFILGKGWNLNFVDYQLRRFRREIIYQYKHLFNNLS